MDHSVKLTREQLLNTLYGTSYNMDGSVVKDTETIRNYTIEVIDKKVHLKTFNIPVQILVENEWCDIENVVSDEDLSLIYSTFQEVHLDSEIILDTDDPTGISVRSRERVRDLSNLISEAGIDLPREFTWVDGASETSGVIILPQDDYEKVFIATDPDKDGIPSIVFIESQIEEEQERPYYVKENGKTYIYVNHFSGGGGSQDSPYLVENEEDLNNVRNNLSAYYTQTQDIIMTSYQTGSGWNPISNFSGFFDGRGFEIKDLYIKRTQNNIGLFGEQKNGTIRRVRLTNVSITGNGSYVAALVGLKSNGEISDCAVLSGEIRNEGVSASRTGGIVGEQGSGTIKRNYNHAAVYSDGSFCGGIIGKNSAGSISSCYSTGKVIDTTLAKNASYHGGFCGSNSGSIPAEENFYNIDAQNKVAKGEGTPLSEVDMKKVSSYPYNFRDRWHMGDYHINKGYPENRSFIKYKKGKGTPNDPYLIYNLFDLEQVRHFADAHFRMENDIIFDYPKTGNGWTPIGSGDFEANSSKWWGTQFSGSFDGNGKAIGNLYIRRRAESHVGLFKSINPGGILKNLTLIDVDVELGYWGGLLAGALGSGSSSSFSRIENCHVRKFNDFIYKTFPGSGKYGCGGLVGIMGGYSEIENCSFNAPVQQQNGFYGGIVGGVLSNTKIKKCSVEGIFDQVSGTMGGIVGVIDYRNANQLFEDIVVHADMSNCSTAHGSFGNAYAGNWYSADYRMISKTTWKRIIVQAKGASRALGNFVVESTYYSTATNSLFPEWVIDNCFYNRDLTGTSSSHYAFSPKFTPELNHESTLVAYDLIDVWGLDEKYLNGSPYLKKHRPSKLPILGFRNEIGLYYTDEAGNILRYLEYGTLVAGSTSEAYPVWLQNNADFPVKDMKVWVDPPTVKPGITVQLSLSNNPFVPVDEIPFSGTIPIGDARQFYIRFLSEVTVTEGGTFDMKAKASPA
ncbi:halomucin [Bacillus cereus]|uniref:Halomucin n=2 Tax=Bacillus cereus TaxID=1396 RepID=A0A9X6WWN3_BACCE|nr:halomucin [Bacillus cereus]PFK11111.1 halomucin [Bacillus cereus]